MNVDYYVYHIIVDNNDVLSYICRLLRLLRLLCQM